MTSAGSRADTDVSVHINEHPAKASRCLAAGAPTRCQNAGCGKPFGDRCQRGEDDRYYCSEVCARSGRDFRNVVRLGSA